MKRALQDSLSHYSGRPNKGIVIMKNYIFRLEYFVKQSKMVSGGVYHILDVIDFMDYGQEVFYVLRELWCSDFG